MSNPGGKNTTPFFGVASVLILICTVTSALLFSYLNIGGNEQIGVVLEPFSAFIRSLWVLIIGTVLSIACALVGLVKGERRLWAVFALVSVAIIFLIFFFGLVGS